MGLQGFGIAIVSAIAMVATLSGCSLATHDNPQDKGPLKMTLPQEACLKTSVPIIQNYFQGNGSPDEVNAAWDCVSGALSMFVTSTRGADPNFYTSRELRTFLETFYLGDIKVSDQLLTEIMRVKQLLLGGTDDRLTHEELAQAQNVVQVLRIESLRMLPYVRYISQQVTVAEAQKDPAQVEAAIAAFTQSVGTLGTLLGRGPDAYSTTDLENLLTDLAPIFKDWKGPTQAISYLPTFSVIKALVMNPPGNVIAPAEWQPLLNKAGQVYALYMRSHYLMSNVDLMGGAGLQQLMLAYTQVTDLLNQSIAAKANHVIQFQQIDDAIDELIRLDLVDARFRDTTLKALVRTLFQTYLNPASSGARPKVTGIAQKQFNLLHDIGAAFLEMQRAYGQVSDGLVSTGAVGAGQPIPLQTFVGAWAGVSTAYPDAQEDLRRLMTQASPLTFRDNGTIIFDNRPSQLVLDEVSFTRYNWQSAAARALVRGYSTDATSNRWTGVTQTQLKSFFGDIYPLGVDMEILEPSDDDLWQTSFNESNMFTLSAVNDDHMSYYEIFDYIGYLLGGGVMSDRAYADVKETCSHEGVDSFNRPTMEINCFRSRYIHQFPTFNAELPAWASIVSSLSGSDAVALENQMEAAARTGGLSDAPISTSDITRMTMVMQYIESLFVRFDTNRDGYIDYNEAQKALPLFKTLLATGLGGSPSDHKVQGLFMYILKNGKPPTSIGDKLYFAVVWLNSDSSWKKVKASRSRLLDVIAALKAQAASTVSATAARVAQPLPPGAILPVNQ